jgi:RNA polymerase sigma factor (sigma-70 family)
MSPKESKKITSAYKQEHNRLLGYIRKKIRYGPDAEDILQDIFYQLTLGFNDIRRIESLTAWLYRVADNRITDFLRKKKHKTLSYNNEITHEEDGPLSLEEILPSVFDSPADEELREMVWETIEVTLSELPEEQRSVFVKNEFEGQSFKEISAETGVGINTLISRKRYAVLALRKNLNELYKLLKTN